MYHRPGGIKFVPHSVIITDITIFNGDYYFVIKNSWGENIGRSGFHYIKCDIFWKYVFSAIGIFTEENTFLGLPKPDFGFVEAREAYMHKQIQNNQQTIVEFGLPHGYACNQSVFVKHPANPKIKVKFDADKLKVSRDCIRYVVMPSVNKLRGNDDLNPEKEGEEEEIYVIT